MEMRYTKVPFSIKEKSFLQEQAKAKGMRLSKYIREVLFSERSCEIEFNQTVIEEHTRALNRVREGLQELHQTTLEDKILLTGFFREMHQKMCCMEQDEAKIRKDIRQIKNTLRSESLER